MADEGDDMQTVGSSLEDADLCDVSGAVAAPGHMDDGIEGRRRLGVHSLARQPSRDSEGFEARGDVGRGVRVNGGASALVAGVEGGQHVDNLGAAHLADDEAIGTHPQRLPNKIAHGDLAGQFDVRGTGLEGHHVRMRRTKLG